VNRSFSASIITAFRRRNAALRWVMLIVTGMLGVTLLVPFVQRMFRFGPLHADDLAVTVAAGLLAIIILEVLKPHWRKRLMT
jgi:Ca2+-transporting ATPase